MTDFIPACSDSRAAEFVHKLSPGRNVMRHFLFHATMVVAAVGSISSATANDRYCLQGGTWGFPGNCQFSTYHQCMASASGTKSHCGINPRYAHHRQHHPQG